MTGHDHCHETVDPATRDAILAEYKHRCQGCGRCGPAAGGMATLHVHHLTRDVDDMDEHDPENLTVLCRQCHSWQHQQTSEEDVPIELTDDDMTVLLPQDIETLRMLATSGPATTGEITSALSADLSVNAVRERLWVLMGLDNQVASRERQIVDQDADTGKWGLVEQIEHSSRGRIPDDPQTLLQRAEDERVRQALDRGCDRDAVADVIGIVPRTTFHKEKRARAYDLPLEALDDKGGRPPVGDQAESTDQAHSEEGDAAQLQLEAATESSPDQSGHCDSVSDDRDSPEAAGGNSNSDEQPVADGGGVRTHLQQAIQALEALEAEL